jgi:hypothetical protein
VVGKKVVGFLCPGRDERFPSVMAFASSLISIFARLLSSALFMQPATLLKVTAKDKVGERIKKRRMVVRFTKT